MQKEAYDYTCYKLFRLWQLVIEITIYSISVIKVLYLTGGMGYGEEGIGGSHVYICLLFAH